MAEVKSAEISVNAPADRHIQFKDYLALPAAGESSRTLGRSIGDVE